jgi:hypothetical protein
MRAGLGRMRLSTILQRAPACAGPSTRGTAPRRGAAARAGPAAPGARIAAADAAALARTTPVIDYTTPPDVLRAKEQELASIGPGGIPKALVYAGIAPFVWLAGALSNLPLLVKVRLRRGCCV